MSIRILVLAAALVVASPAHAADFGDDSTGTLLARVYVSEAGWERRADHVAIYWALRNRAAVRGVPFRDHLLAYARGLHAGSSRGRWVRGLRPDLRAGADWPARYPWPAFRGLWARVVAFAATDVVFPPESRCDGVVEHWGGPTIRSDSSRAGAAVLAGRWRQLDCGPTKNAFFSVRGRRGLSAAR